MSVFNFGGTYRKRPVTVEAARWDGTFQGADRVIAWAIERGAGPGMRYVQLGPSIDIPTLEGVMLASPGDWVIRGVKGEFYPCKPDIFEATHEEVAS